jgi:hypothetical protein
MTDLMKCFLYEMKLNCYFLILNNYEYSKF